MAPPLRIYLDTSVIGGCFDEKFAFDSRRVFDLAIEGKLAIIISDIVLTELAPAPEPVRAVLDVLPTELLDIRRTDLEITALRDAYLARGVLSKRWIDDATNVAIATVARADALVSWNFRHIVRLDRIKAFNQVNLANGYGILTILSPTELREHEARDDPGV